MVHLNVFVSHLSNILKIFKLKFFNTAENYSLMYPRWLDPDASSVMWCDGGVHVYIHGHVCLCTAAINEPVTGAGLHTVSGKLTHLQLRKNLIWAWASIH